MPVVGRPRHRRRSGAVGPPDPGRAGRQCDDAGSAGRVNARLGYGVPLAGDAVVPWDDGFVAPFLYNLGEAGFVASYVIPNQSFVFDTGRANSGPATWRCSEPP